MHDHLTLETGARLDFFVEGTGDALLIYHHGTPAAGSIPLEVSVPAAAHGMVVAGIARPGYGGSTREPEPLLPEPPALPPSVSANLPISSRG